MKNKRNRIKRKAFAGMIAIGLMLSFAGCGVVVEEAGEKTATAHPQDSKEAAATKDLRPQDDYYTYINRDTLAGLAVNYSDIAVGPIEDIDQTVDEEIFALISEIVDSDEPFEKGSNEQIVKAAYGQFLSYFDEKDNKSVSSAAKEYYFELAEKIRNSSDIEDMKDNLHMLMSEGIVSYFNVHVDSNYFDGENYALYIEQMTQFCGFELKDIYEDDDTRQSLHAYATEVLVANGAAPEAASKRADDFVYFLIDLSCATDFEIMEAVNPILTLKETSNSDMNQILHGMTVEELQGIYEMENPYGSWIIQDAEQITFLSTHLADDNIENVKLFMLCQLMDTYKDFLQEDYVFLEDRALQADRDNAAMASLIVSTLFTTEINELYAKYYYTEEMDTQLHQMYDDIIASYHELISNAAWLTGETRQALLKKLHNMYFVAGGGKPHEVKAEDSKVIGNNAFETMVNVNKRRIQADRSHIGMKLDKTQCSMASYVVNSVYSPSNTFTITVGIMHAPYFDVNADYATNMGGLGMVMGHEIGHAFDSNCIAYDENGVYHPDWICREDREKLKMRLEQMEAYYSEFTIMDIYHVDGKKTSGENYADKGAMECLMNIFDDEREQEKLFESYARIWCMLTEDSYAIESLTKDEHSPNEIRVNAVLSSTREFYEVYDLKPGDGMYIEPEKQVSRWK